MKATKIYVSEEPRIKIDFPFNRETTDKIRQISGASWSSILKAWHLPYRKEVFQQLKSLFPEVEYPNQTTRLGVQQGGRESDAMRGAVQKSNVRVEVLGRKILLTLPKDETDIHFIRGIRYSRWDKKLFCWVVPHYPGNLELIREYFRERIDPLIFSDDIEVGMIGMASRFIKRNELLIIRTTSGRMKVIGAFNTELSHCIRKFPFHHWDGRNKCWTMPFAEKFLEELREVGEACGLEVLYEKEMKPEGGSARIAPEDVVGYRQCPVEYRNKLIELRYSKNTQRTYCSLFEEFINYYSGTDLNQIDGRMIIDFLQYLVMERKVSLSYQNQSINAIKFYYERLLGLPRKVYHIERPRRERKLPTVLNEEEVSRVIRLVGNLKHKAIIMIIYSSGLRLSELLNLKITDIDSQRMQVFIRQAKGRKDRYTLLSQKALLVLREYVRKYRPKEWLFEGAGGEQYSETSVQAIVKEAYRRAGIRKPATVHTLRHCFGTHLLENGTDLRYIQALMGHASSKTTEIYTHVTTKGFSQIANPMDKLDI